MAKPQGIVGSALLHIGVIGATLVAWTTSRALDDTPAEVIPVQMVDIADVTNIRPMTREQPKPPEVPLEDVTPTPAVEIPPEPKPAPAPQESPPPPVEKPHPQKPQANFDPDRILALLDKSAPRTAPPAQAVRGPQNQRGIGDMNAATMDIQAAFLEQMRECWNFPIGAPHPEQLVVQVEVFLTRDGHLAQPPQLSDDTRAAEGRNPYMRAAADAALRAISICEPYKLPADRYAIWRDLTLVFDPSKMAGR